MRRFALKRPSPALVVAFIALLVALGGTSFAAFNLPKNSVGTKQLKNKAVTTKKIKNGAVTASKINTSGLTVPNAVHASSADAAVNATNATNATNAGNATTVNGRTVGCGAGTVQFLGQCFETSLRAAANIFDASDTCTAAGGYLGSELELLSGRRGNPLTLDSTGEWAGLAYNNNGANDGLTVSNGLIPDFEAVGINTLHPYRCVFPLVG
jgi:hypothetical protein